MSSIYSNLQLSYTPLTREEELDCANKIRQFSETSNKLLDGTMDLEEYNRAYDMALRSRKKLVEANIPFIITVASRAAKKYTLPSDDVINEAMIGLIHAVDTYNPFRSPHTIFLSYAARVVQNKILDYLTTCYKTTPIRQCKQLRQYRRFCAQFQKTHARKPTPDEVIAHLKITPKKLAELDLADIQQAAIESLSDVVIIQDNYDDTKEYIEHLLSRLSDREVRILKLFFGIDTTRKNMNEIGKLFGLTRERVRQIKNKALDKLRIMSRTREVF